MDIICALESIVGLSHVLRGADAAPCLTDWRGRFTGQALAVVRPGSTREVADIVKICARERLPIVPQGGNTGLVGGATPDGSGTAGDGNLHYNVGSSEGFSDEALTLHQAEIYQLVHDSVHAHGGSISAEHGVGQLKVDELARYKSAQELRTMARIKRALDPLDILNPGKVLRAREQGADHGEVGGPYEPVTE